MFATLYRCRFLHVLALLLCMVANGCRRDSSKSTASQKQDPEESLKLIVRYLERNVAQPYFDTSRGLGKNDISTVISSSTVSHELLKPDETRDTYWARITIETSQTYASKQLDSKDENEQDQKSKQEESNTANNGENLEDMLGLSDDSYNIRGMAMPDSTANNSGSADKANSKTPTFQRSEGTWKDIVELKYEKNQWVLASEIKSEWLRSDMERVLELHRYGILR
ncbi:MAG: hypothetical protein JW829_11405 [Pirellulales bacterium]|nr:hypothetical protein [Pirellulales bacterium]